MQKMLVILSGAALILTVGLYLSIDSRQRPSFFTWFLKNFVTKAGHENSDGRASVTVMLLTFGILPFWVVGAYFYVDRMEKEAEAAIEAARASRETVRASSDTGGAQGLPPSESSLPYEVWARKNREDAEAALREFDKGQEQLLEEYARQAVSRSTSTLHGVRIDTFRLKNGTAVICSTTFRNNARATSCQ